MNKTLTVNLNNSVYNIDDSAFDVLRDYLESLKKHFDGEEGADEILSDIEARISELFNARIRYGMQVITLREVNEVIGIMGHPEDFEKDILEPESTESSESTEKNRTADDEKTEEEPAGTYKETAKEQKRFFRNPDNRMLGGVASGLACYVGVDTTVIRIIFVILAFFWGTSIWIYLLLWLFIPEAQTATQKLQMMGEAVTVDNIKRIVKEEMEKTNEIFKNVQKNSQPYINSVGNQILAIIRGIFKFVFTLFGGCLGFLLLIILIAIVVSCLSLTFAGLNLSDFQGLMDGNIYYMIRDFHNPGILLIGLALTLGIPIYSLFRVIIGSIFHFQPQSKVVSWVLLILWIIGIAMIFYLSLNYIPKIIIHSTTQQIVL